MARPKFYTVDFELDDDDSKIKVTVHNIYAITAERAIEFARECLNVKNTDWRCVGVDANDNPI